MKLSQIREVLAIAERGSMRSAARQLGVAQPVMTRSIRELEHELGVLLFERRVTGMILTPMGEAFVRRATAIQLDLDRVRDELQQLRGETVGTVSAGLSTVAHVALLPRIIEPFRRRFPGVRLKLVEGLFPTLEPDIQDGKVDFYVGPLAENFQPAELLVERLFDNRRVVVGRRGHPLANARSLKDLVDAHWVTTAITMNVDAELGPMFESYGLPHPHIALQTETALSMLIATAHSDLLAMLPQQWLAYFQPTGTIEHIPVAEMLPAPPICIVRRARLPLTPAAEFLCDLFRRIGHNHALSLAGTPD